MNWQWTTVADSLTIGALIRLLNRRMRGLQQSLASNSAATLVTTVTSSVTLDDSYGVVYVNSASGDVTVTLPASPLTGQQYTICRVSTSNAVTVGRNSNNIQGAASDLSLTSLDSVRIGWGGATHGWRIL